MPEDVRDRSLVDISFSKPQPDRMSQVVNMKITKACLFTSSLPCRVVHRLNRPRFFLLPALAVNENELRMVCTHSFDNRLGYAITHKYTAMLSTFYRWPRYDES